MNAIAVAIAASMLSFAMGFAIRRGTVCVVVAAQDLVVRRRPDKFIGFATAACWSGLLLVPLAWLAPAVFHLSPGYDQLIQALLFGCLYGIGAWANPCKSRARSQFPTVNRSMVSPRKTGG